MLPTSKFPQRLDLIFVLKKSLGFLKKTLSNLFDVQTVFFCLNGHVQTVWDEILRLLEVEVSTCAGVLVLALFFFFLRERLILALDR
jgi:hypothetical protein